MNLATFDELDHQQNSGKNSVMYYYLYTRLNHTTEPTYEFSDLLDEQSWITKSTIPSVRYVTQMTGAWRFTKYLDNCITDFTIKWHPIKNKHWYANIFIIQVEYLIHISAQPNIMSIKLLFMSFIFKQLQNLLSQDSRPLDLNIEPTISGVRNELQNLFLCKIGSTKHAVCRNLILLLDKKLQLWPLALHIKLQRPRYSVLVVNKSNKIATEYALCRILILLLVK